MNTAVKLLSLKWKALIGLTLLLIMVNCGLGYLGYRSLERQQEYQLDLMTRRFANNFNHLLEQNAQHLQSLSESALLAGRESLLDGGSLQGFFDRYWDTLRSKWELDSVTLFDARGEPEAAWGDQRSVAVMRALAATAREKSHSVNQFHCIDAQTDSTCSLLTAVPLPSVQGQQQILTMGSPVADLIIDFSRDNFFNIALLNRAKVAHSELTINKWGFNLVASSDLPAALDLLQDAATTFTLKQLLEGGREVAAKDGRYFYLRAIVATDTDTHSDVIMMLMDDISAQRAALHKRLLQVALFAAFGMLISEIALLAILWQPMERIKWQSKALPLLADGDYASVYSWPGNRNIKYRDELDILEDASIVLAERLEKMSFEIRRRSRELEYFALYDALTGLANRRLFVDYLTQAGAEHERTQHGFAVLFIDIDNFKRINDSLGHNIGDDLLIEVARRLKAVTRSSDSVARLGGDEFIILLRRIDTEPAVVSIIRKILHALHEPLHLGDRTVGVTASIGVALAPHHGLDPSLLMKNADMAMYQAKALGRNTYQFFTETISAAAENLLDKEIELARALEQREFVLFYQPIVGFPQCQVVGLEVLVRWNHPTRGLIPPDDFIPVMESNGMITELDRQVIGMACRELRSIQHEAGLPLTLSINLSTHLLRDDALVELLQHEIEHASINPRHLKLEVTESALMENIVRASVVLEQLKALGVKLSIDDFGTGYSSLNYLQKLPVDELKVDRSFVRDIPDDKTAMEITSAVIAMAHKLQLDVVAEGIENEQQIDFLLNCHCDFGQGYFFHKPAPRADIVAWLQTTSAVSAPVERVHRLHT